MIEKGVMPRIVGKLTIHNSIPELRSKIAWTQQELADAIEVTRGTIIALEKGSYNPSLELAFRLAKIFKTSIENIFFEKRGRS
jgi:putative transcriptional regulator